MSVSAGRKSRSSRRFLAVPLMLGALAPAIAACGTGDGTIQPAGTCGHFVTTVQTSQSGYAPGQTVTVSVTQVNEGPTCYGIPPEWCGSLQAWASAYNSAGQEVWDAGARKTVQGIGTCPFAAAPGPEWPARYSNTQKLGWRQDKCAPAAETGQPGQHNPNCPGTQVAAGTYRIVGNGTSAPATITISG